MEENIYQEKGYKNRNDYLQALAEDYNLDFQLVSAMANVLGPDEDFDGLITTLDTAAELSNDYLMEDFDDEDDDFEDDFDDDFDDFDDFDDDDEDDYYDYMYNEYYDDEDDEDEDF